MSHVRITIDLGTEQAAFDITSTFHRADANPADEAALELATLVADAKTWLAARQNITEAL